LAAILCTCAFRYDAALCRRKADKQAVAARTDWRESTLQDIQMRSCACLLARLLKD